MQEISLLVFIFSLIWLVFLIEPDFADLTRVVTQEAPEISYLCIPMSGIIGTFHGGDQE